jgi:hypothetical protein
LLTVKQIENARPGNIPYKLFDGGGAGLYLQGYPNGSRLWRLTYSFEGKRRVKALGAWPEVSLREAREKGAELKKEVYRGKDPLKPETRQDPVFRDVAREWADRFLPGLAGITRRQTLSKLNGKILPAIGGMKLDGITPPVVLNLVLRPIEAEGKMRPCTASRPSRARFSGTPWPSA